MRTHALKTQARLLLAGLALMLPATGALAQASCGGDFGAWLRETGRSAILGRD